MPKYPAIAKLEIHCLYANRARGRTGRIGASLVEPNFPVADHHSLIADKQLIDPLTEYRAPDLRREDPVVVTLDRLRVAIEAGPALRIDAQREVDELDNRTSIIGPHRNLKT
jgi:hypothetical protein